MIPMARLVQVGNSLGIRLPKAVIEMAGLEGCELDLKVVEEGVLITPVRPRRSGWSAAFQAMHAAGEDKPLLDDTMENRFDKEEWEW